jgi:hypothetical protein
MYMTELSKDHKEKIIKLWNDSPLFCAYIEEQLSIRIPPADLIVALMESTGLDFKELAQDEWTNEKILTTVKTTTWLSKFPVIQEEAIVEVSIIPNEVVRGINEEQVKFKGEKWIVHKNDADPLPSRPHAHNYESGLKLHLGNGNLYDGTRIAGAITCKNLKHLRGLFVNTAMPTLEC